MKQLGRVALSLFAASQIWLGIGGIARAEVDWCGGDPPVHVSLPSGQPLEVNAHVQIPSSDRDALRTISVIGQVLGVQDGVATVQLSIAVPDDGSGSFPVQATVSSHGSSVAVSGTSGPVPTYTTVNVALPPGLAK
ncbi:MAG: hypothetical protein ACRDIY_05720 [Chloroflexota bacterium]